MHVYVVLLSSLKIPASMSWANCSRGSQPLLTCWMWEHLPCQQPSSSECNLIYRNQFQEIPSQKSYSFISVTCLLLHDSASCRTFNLFALQTDADHSLHSPSRKNIFFYLFSISTVASLYSRVWPEKNRHVKKNICQALYLGKTNQTTQFHDMIL